MLTIIESVQESPGVIIAAQIDQAKSELMAEMKAAGVEYEERIERLSQVEPPKPNKDWIYDSFNEFRAKHPWVGSDTVQPKSIVRDMWERVMTFTEYVNHYGLKRSEGVVLRYLSDVYKGLMQNVPEDDRTDEIDDLIAWLGAVVRQVDSSLIDEWERLLEPDRRSTRSVRSGDGSGTNRADVSVVDNERAFRVMVRNQMFDWVQRVAARRGYDAFGLTRRHRPRPCGDGRATTTSTTRCSSTPVPAAPIALHLRPAGTDRHADPPRSRRHQRVADHRPRRRRRLDRSRPRRA